MLLAAVASATVGTCVYVLTNLLAWLTEHGSFF